MFKSRASMVLSAVFAFLVLYCIFSYNSLVSMDESTSAKWLMSKFSISAEQISFLIL